MNIAIDISPLKSGHFLQHRVRGTGFYLTNLKEALVENFSKNNYIFFNRGDKLPSNIELIHYPYFEPFFLTLPFTKNMKSVVTVHDLTPLVFPDKFPTGVKGRLKWETQKINLKRMDHIITDSYSSKVDIQKFVKIPPNKIEVVYLAAAKHFKKNDGEIKKKIIKKFNLPEEFLLYVGDATWNKNLPNLIRAINKTDYNLVIVGGAFVNKDFDRSNPWNHDLHEAQVLSSQNQRIEALGFVPDEDLVALYNCATAFIMPSFYEGFGLPVLEAMQSGCPVITTKKGSLQEVADSAAYFVEPDSIDSIKEGIESVMKDKDLRKALSKKGIEQAKKFTWNKTARETQQVYEKV